MYIYILHAIHKTQTNKIHNANEKRIRKNFIYLFFQYNNFLKISFHISLIFIIQPISTSSAHLRQNSAPHFIQQHHHKVMRKKFGDSILLIFHSKNKMKKKRKIQSLGLCFCPKIRGMKMFFCLSSGWGQSIC